MRPPESAAGGTRFLSSASAIVGDIMLGHHELHIDGYSLTKGELPTGKSIMSHPFRAGDSSWRIKYYPNGFRSEYTDSISIFLALNESVPVPVKAQAIFGLLDPADKPVQGSIKFMNLREYSGARREFGIAKFIDRQWLETSEYLLNDCLKIFCFVIISEKLRSEDRSAHAPFVVVPPSDLNQHLGNLFVAEDGADVTFQVAGKAFKAHRFLLAARSPVFKAELLGGMKESRAIIGDHIQIDDILPQVFETLLHFVYNDSLPEMEGQEEAMMAQHLLEAADRYDMQRLKLICEDKLCRHLDVSTVATTLVLAEQHNCQGLKEACIEFLKSSDALEAVMETDGFDHMAKSCPALIKELMLKLVTRSRKRK
nr:unnamed protein product [Digitaria exilis]